MPSMSRTCASSTLPAPCAIAWSSSDSASRMLPAAERASRLSAAGSALIASTSRMCLRCAAISDGVICLRLNCRQRESTVTGIFCGSVVARMNLTCSGGSSRVFSMALKAELESMCTSSMTYTLKRPRVGAYTAFSRSWRISSTLVLVAASTSSRSTKRPASISVQAEQTPHGVAVTPASQLNDLARMRASVVLPTPRVPVNR